MHLTRFILPSIILTGLFLISRAEEPPKSPPEPDNRAAAAKGAAKASTDGESLERLNLRYAATSLKLARLNLDQAQDANRRLARAVPSTEVERLKQLVKLAEVEVRKEMKAGQGDQANMNVRTAAANLKVATAEWRSAEEANRSGPGTVQPRELERLRLTAELARLSLARERASGDPKSAAAELQYQIDQLRSEVEDLRTAVAQLKDR